MKAKKAAPLLIAALVCFAAAFFFRFALIGYSVMALVCAGVGVCLLLYAYLPKKFRIMLTVLLVLGLLLFTVGEIPVLKAARGTPEYDAAYLIVLGAGVNGTSPSLSMVDRLSAAIEAQGKGKLRTLCFEDDHAFNRNRAAAREAVVGFFRETL